MYFLVYAIFICELQKIFFLRDMMDNQCANIFSTHATVYGSHSAMFAFYLKREYFFFMCILNLVFKFGLCVFIFPTSYIFPQNNFFPKHLFCVSYFYRGRSLFLTFVLHRGSCLYFFIELIYFMFPWFSFFSLVYCHSTLCLSCLCQYVTKRGRNK